MPLVVAFFIIMDYIIDMANQEQKKKRKKTIYRIIVIIIVLAMFLAPALAIALTR